MSPKNMRELYTSLQDRIHTAHLATRTLEIDIYIMCGKVEYATRTERAKLEALRARARKLEDRFTALLAEVSPRDWMRGVSCVSLWDLPYDDAVTAGPLSNVTRSKIVAAYGYQAAELTPFLSGERMFV